MISNTDSNKDTYKGSFWDIIREGDYFPSLGRFQFFLWTIVISFAFLSIYLIRADGGVFSFDLKALPNQLMELMGISVFVPVVGNALSKYKYSETISDSIPPQDKIPPFSTMFLVLERRTKLGWTDIKYTNVVDDLLKKRKIERIKIKLGRGSPKILYQRPGKVPSIKHEYYVELLAENLTKKGYQVRKNRDGADLEVPEVRTAIEVELGTSNISGNLKRNLQKFSRVIVCSDDIKLIETLSGKIRTKL